jgi:hypothetical protein
MEKPDGDLLTTEMDELNSLKSSHINIEKQDNDEKDIKMVGYLYKFIYFFILSWITINSLGFLALKRAGHKQFYIEY